MKRRSLTVKEMNALCLLTLCLLTLCALGCEEARRSPVLGHQEPSAQAGEPHTAGQTAGETAGAMSTTELPPATRAPRRLTVAQLARSIEVVTGGLRWVEDLGQGPVDMLTLLAPTLGAPDYRSVTHESLEPSLLLSKFAQDGAQRVCERWVAQDRDPNLSLGSLVHSEGVEGGWESLEPSHVTANLERLLLTFFAYSPRGTLSGDGSAAPDPRVQALRELFELVAATAPSDPAGDAWLAVCVALMTDPEFLMY